MYRIRGGILVEKVTEKMSNIVLLRRVCSGNSDLNARFGVHE